MDLYVYVQIIRLLEWHIGVYIARFMEWYRRDYLASLMGVIGASVFPVGR
jgi:hypothetical protein